MPDDLSHEQTAVTGQQDAPIPAGDLRHERIVIRIFVQAVKSQHTQVCGQPAEVTVKQESRFDRTAICNWMCFDSISILGDMPHRFIPAVDLYRSDLGVRDSQRLGQVFDGLAFLESNRDLLIFLIPAQEFIQPAME